MSSDLRTSRRGTRFGACCLLVSPRRCYGFQEAFRPGSYEVEERIFQRKPTSPETLSAPLESTRISAKAAGLLGEYFRGKITSPLSKERSKHPIPGNSFPRSRGRDGGCEILERHLESLKHWGSEFAEMRNPRSKGRKRSENHGFRCTTLIW